MATRSAKIDQKADLIWAIADKLTGVYKPHEYGDVILPLTVIRRFDCILSDTKDAVLQKYDEVKNLPMKDILLRKASKKDFYNTSKYTFERLMDDPDHIEENFREYLNKFSANVRDILEKFKFDGHITTMANKGILYIVLKEYTTDRGNLHPNEISNLEMGYIFEEIIRRFSESHNEDAGQHYTPREAITVSPFNSKQEQTLSEHIEFSELEILQLSEFYEITARSGDDTIRRIIMIPTSGFPDDRESAAVNSVVKDRASFVEYIAFVLGDDYVASMLEGKQMGESGFFANSSDAMPALYEKMLKTSVEGPERIKDIGYVLKMVTDKDIIPDEFRELYETFCNTLKIRR